MALPQVGQTMTTWFSDRMDRRSTILEVQPYRGRYPQFFDCVLIFSAPRTKRGSLEMAYDSREAEHG